jgi:hypothetical protein
MTEWLIKGQRNVYTYERDGRMKDCTAYLGDRLSHKTRYSYEDDDHGNWTVRREEEFFSSEDGWVASDDVTYREITYFK